MVSMSCGVSSPLCQRKSYLSTPVHFSHPPVVKQQDRSQAALWRNTQETLANTKNYVSLMWVELCGLSVE